MGRQKIVISDLGCAAAKLAFGAIVGLMFGMLGVVVVRGFWIVLLPALLIQLLFEAVFSRIFSFIMSFFKKTPKEIPESPSKEYPWWRRYSFYVGFPMVAAYGIFCVWSV